MKYLKRIVIRVLYWVQVLIFFPMHIALAIHFVWIPYWLLTGRNVFSDYTNYQPLTFNNFVPTNKELDEVGKRTSQRDEHGKRMHTIFGTGQDSAFGSGNRSMWSWFDDDDY